MEKKLIEALEAENNALKNLLEQYEKEELLISELLRIIE
jgi:hypothetical protein